MLARPADTLPGDRLESAGPRGAARHPTPCLHYVSSLPKGRTMRSTWPHWICQTCKKPITEKGVIEIVNTDPFLGPVGDHPRPLDYDDGASHVGFRVYHVDTCDPFPDREGEEGYWIDVPRARTFEQWAAWVIHVGRKTWMTKIDSLFMLEFWWTHKGEAPRIEPR